MEITAVSQEVSPYNIPLSENKAKEWIDSLSVTDFGESTKRIFHGLVDLNRRALPSGARVRIGEKLMPKFDVLLSNLQRHLNQRSFPLPERSQRIFDLSQALLLEYAGLYQLAALDMLTRDEGGKRDLQTAIYRVIDYLGQYLLSSYSVYSRTGETIWHDIHHMYLLASERGLDMKKFDGGRENARSIEARYIQINLLALFKPYTLRQEEIVRIARYVETVTPLVRISQEPLAEERIGDIVHAALLNNDEPAVLMPYRDLPHSPTVRVFNMRKLILQLDEMIQELAQDQLAGLTMKNGLSRNLIKRMIFNLTTVRNRSSNRFAKQEKLAVVLGLHSVLDALSKQVSMPTAEDRREEDMLFSTMTYGELNYVAQSKPQLQKAAGGIDLDRGIYIWDMINSSVGGYGLFWPHKEPSSVRVGELVGLRDMSSDENLWMVGVIKWMEFINKKGLFCGVEVLSSKLLELEVVAVNNRKIPQRLPLPGLMLPSVEGLRPDPVIILPSYVLQSGDELQVKLQGRQERVSLAVLDECLGSFAHFRFKKLSDNHGKESEGFESLWGTL